MSSQSKSVVRYNEAEAKYPAYIAVSKRRESFAVWPNKSEIQCGKNMALAGFFYIGSADRARCFYCGLTLRDWDDDDDPFAVHKQWSPNCGYISHIAEQQLSSGIQSLHVTENGDHTSTATVTQNGELRSTATVTQNGDRGNTATIMQNGDHGSYMVTENGDNRNSATVTSLCTSGLTLLPDLSTDAAHASFNQGETIPDAKAENLPTSSSSTFGAFSHASQVTERHMDSHVTGTGSADIETVPARTWEHPPHVQAILDMGYTMDRVRQATDERRLAGGEDFTDAPSLLCALEGWTKV